jgi:L,D-transpeptidase catalytic domain
MSAGPEWDLTSPAIALRCNSGGQFLRLVKKKHCVCCRDLAIQRDNQHSRRQREQPGVIMKTYLNCGYLPGYPASHGCVRMPRDLAALFFERVQIGTPVTVVGSTHNLARVRKALPLLSTGSYVLGKR